MREYLVMLRVCHSKNFLILFNYEIYKQNFTVFYYIDYCLNSLFKMNHTKSVVKETDSTHINAVIDLALCNCRGFL